MLILDCCFTTDVGKVRKNNEDNFFLNGYYKRNLELISDEKKALVLGGGVFAVCDGMGGEEFGEKASLLAVETLKDYDYKDFEEYVSDYVDKANEKICRLITENAGKRSGTTLALLNIHNGIATGYNIGDSRIYLFRNRELKQISEDHTRVAQMVKMGILTKENASNHKERHVLTQHLGIFPDELLIEAYKSAEIGVCKNDIYLLCSDGLTDMLTDEEIDDIIKNQLSAKKLARTLQEAALEKGGKDNVTVGIIKIVG